MTVSCTPSSSTLWNPIFNVAATVAREAAENLIHISARDFVASLKIKPSDHLVANPLPKLRDWNGMHSEFQGDMPGGNFAAANHRNVYFSWLNFCAVSLTASCQHHIRASSCSISQSHIRLNKRSSLTRLAFSHVRGRIMSPQVQMRW